MNRELAAEFLELAERLHDLALRIEAEANEKQDEVPFEAVFMTPIPLFGVGIR